MQVPLVNRLRAAYNGFRRANNSLTPDDPNFVHTFFKQFAGQPSPTVQDWARLLMRDEDFYTGHGYAAINNRANKVVTLGMEHLITKANPRIMEEAKKKGVSVKHPYLKLLEESPTFSDDAFWYMASTYIDLEGPFYLLALRNKDGNRYGDIQEFKLLNTFEVTRVRSMKEPGQVEAYIETRDGMYREIPPHMIIDIRKLNPKKWDEPFGLADAAKDSQFALKQSGDHMIQTLMRNKKFPGVVMVGDGDILMEPEQLENLKKRMTGVDKRGEPVFTSGQGALNWVDMQIDLKKSLPDLVNEVNLKSLTAVSGNSKTMSGIEESGTTRETSKTQRDIFIENQAIPQLRLIISALNQDYRNHYPTEYENTGYKIAIDNPLGTDHEAEAKDIENRKSVQELYKTMRGQGYSHEIAAKYSKGEIDLMDIGEPTEVKKQEEKPDPPLPAENQAQKVLLPIVINQPVGHACEHSEIAKNQIGLPQQGSTNSQAAMLENSVLNIEARVVGSVLNKVAKNQFEQQSDIIDEAEKQKYEEELEAALLAFYGVIVPLFAAHVLSRRLSEFGLSASFTMDEVARTYVKGASQRAAISHIDTIVDDLLTAIKETENDLVQRAVDAIKSGPEGAGMSDSEIYQLAQKKALEGAGRREIEAAIRSKYNDISLNRAKAIARSETNRAFNQAQYQADLQFMKENGLEGKMYKRLRTRSGNPCPLCVTMASRGWIPLDKPFAKIGDEIVATYEEDGKTKVLKQKVTYEDIIAGDIHTNCGCTYEISIRE